MTDPKTTTPTPLQVLLRCFKQADADSVRRMIGILDARYVRISPLPFTHDATVGALADVATLANGIPVDTAPTITQVAAEVNGAGKQRAGDTETGPKPKWDRRTLDEFFRLWDSSSLGTPETVEEVRKSGGDSATLNDILCLFTAGHDGGSAYRVMTGDGDPAATKLETALVSELDAICGPNELVDCNLEKPGDYLDALRLLIEMAKKSRDNHHIFELNGHIEAGGFVAADPSLWANGLHRPTLEAVGDLLRKRATELYAEQGQLLQCMNSPSQIRPDAYAAKYLASRNSIDEIWRTQLGIEGELVRGGTGSRS